MKYACSGTELSRKTSVNRKKCNMALCVMGACINNNADVLQLINRNDGLSLFHRLGDIFRP